MISNGYFNVNLFKNPLFIIERQLRCQLNIREKFCFYETTAEIFLIDDTFASRI